MTRLRIGAAGIDNYGGWADVKQGSRTAIHQAADQLTQDAGAVIEGPSSWQPLGGVTPKGPGPAAAGLKIDRKQQHLEALPLEEALGAAHVEGTGDQQDAGTSRQAIENGGRFLRSVHHRWRAGHGGSSDTKLARFLQVELVFRWLAVAEGAGATGEQQSLRLAGAVEIEAARKRSGSSHSLTRAAPGAG